MLLGWQGFIALEADLKLDRHGGCSSSSRCPQTEDLGYIRMPAAVDSGVLYGKAAKVDSAVAANIEELGMGIDEMLAKKREEILRIAARHGASNVRIFGSVARGEADDRSDIDFLVDLEPGRSLLDLGGLQADLEAALAWPVDVTTERGLKVRVRDRVLKEAVSL